MLKKLGGAITKVLDVIFCIDDTEKCKHIGECLFHRCDICRRNPSHPDYLIVSRRIRAKRKREE